jgi:hypothetical protein
VSTEDSRSSHDREPLVSESYPQVWVHLPAEAAEAGEVSLRELTAANGVVAAQAARSVEEGFTNWRFNFASDAGEAVVADFVDSVRSIPGASARVGTETTAIYTDDPVMKRELAKQSPGLYARLLVSFFRHDPMGINFGSNTDEYAPEVDTVLPRLSSASNTMDVQRILHEEFVRWFDGSTAGSPERYRPLAEAVWSLWSKSPG